MTYKEISIGARDAGTDESVKKLQQLLNQTGSFQLEEDGIFGVNTQNAVKTYQKANNLKVDGIVGDQTWSSLTKSEPSHPVLGDTAEKNTAPSYTDYTARLEELYDAWSEREPFSYDVGKDPLYRQYQDLYTRQGQLAMLDTMGQAAALTGGYGNSYGQTAGQLAFQDYMQRLAAAVPELYGAAYDRYNAQGDRLLQQYTLAKDMADTAYQKQTDSYNKLTSLLPLGYSPTDEELTAAGMTRPQANTLSNYYQSQTARSNSGYSYTGGSVPQYNNGDLTVDQVRALQEKLREDGYDITVDGMYGAESSNAVSRYYKAKGRGVENISLRDAYYAIVYDDFLNEYIAGTGSKSKVSSYLRKAYEEGLISRQEWDAYRAQYVTPGHTY